MAVRTMDIDQYYDWNLHLGRLHISRWSGYHPSWDWRIIDVGRWWCAHGPTGIHIAFGWPRRIFYAFGIHWGCKMNECGKEDD